MILKYLLTICLAIASLSLIQNNKIDSYQAEEQLIVFTNAQKPILKAAEIQALKDLATSLKLAFVLKDIQEGAPKEVVYTPSIVFQNHVNRSFFYGRYKNISRLKNFVRTSRMVHQQESDNFKKDIFVWENGRAKVTAPLKLTDLQGSIPKGFDQEAFKTSTKMAIAKGMKQFELVPSFNQNRTTRSFYFDIHPFLSSDGMLYLTAEIYSQYNCINPIVRKTEKPWLSGSWKESAQVFKRLGQLVENELLQQIQSSEIGDAFTAIPSSIVSKTWDSLNLSLPQKIVRQKADSLQNIHIPQNWEVDMLANQSEPILIFSFLPPLDNYAGEVKKLSGQLKLGKNLNLSDAEGHFEVAIDDLTMGDAGFDDAVKNKMLQMEKYPSASLNFESIKGGTLPIELGKVQDIVVQARFEMLGIQIPIEVPAKIEAILNSAQAIRLQVNASFRLPLFEKFKVEGPDGPSLSKDNLQFYLKYYLKPIEK